MEMSPALATPCANCSRVKLAAVVSQASSTGQPPTFGGSNGSWPRFFSTSRYFGLLPRSFSARSAPTTYSTGCLTSSPFVAVNEGELNAAVNSACRSSFGL
jgi:hypothetical protein